MSKNLRSVIMLSFFLLAAAVFSGGKNVDAASRVRINAANFPDVIFRKRIQIYDKNHNGYLSKSEIKKVKKLDLRNTKYKKNIKNITNYKGIEYFTNLRSLVCGDYESGKSKGVLDLSRNKKLEDVSVGQHPFTSYIKEVKLTNCKNLKELSISNGSRVEKLDVKGCSNLTKIWIGDCDYLKSLDVSSCRKLKELDITEARRLTKVKLGEINKLEILDIGICPLLKKINVKKQTNLKSLRLSKTFIKNLNLKNNKELTGLYLQETPISALDLSNQEKLESLKLFWMKDISQLDLSNQKNLKWIAVRKTKLNRLDLSKTLLTKEKALSRDSDYYCYVYNKNIEIIFADGEKVMSPFNRRWYIKNASSDF